MSLTRITNEAKTHITVSMHVCVYLGMWNGPCQIPRVRMQPHAAIVSVARSGNDSGWEQGWGWFFSFLNTKTIMGRARN